MGHRLSRWMSRVVRRKWPERDRRLKRACFFLLSLSLLVPITHPDQKGRHRAAQERGLPRSHIALVFRALMDRSSQGRRPISAAR